MPSRDPVRWTSRIQGVVWSLDPDLPLAAVEPMTVIQSRASARIAFTAVLIAIAAGAALLLGAIGIYGVVSHAVGRRTTEIGVRMALGARRETVLRMVLRQGPGLALAGVALGLVAAVAQATFLRSLLYDVSPQEPWTLSGVAVGLLEVAALASYLPARRAASIDPIIALRDS
jgi:ABC-type antimicrobial peptide transport system permease subunit